MSKNAPQTTNPQAPAANAGASVNPPEGGADAGDKGADKGASQPSTPPAAEPAPAVDGLKEGDEVILSAVHGEIVHPFMQPEVRFDQGKLTKVVVDRWVAIQYEAGKLRKA